MSTVRTRRNNGVRVRLAFSHAPHPRHTKLAYLTADPGTAQRGNINVTLSFCNRICLERRPDAIRSLLGQTGVMAGMTAAGL